MGGVDASGINRREKSMKVWLKNRRVLLALRIVIGGLFIWAGCLKIGDPQQFADSVASFELLPKQLINLIALGLPPLEVLAGLWLISGWKESPATLALLILTVVFALALGQALVRGLQVDCGCFGAGEPSVWKTWVSLGRDLLLMAGLSWLYGQESNGTDS
jgi:putative oxidoreductase